MPIITSALYIKLSVELTVPKHIIGKCLAANSSIAVTCKTCKLIQNRTIGSLLKFNRSCLGCVNSQRVGSKTEHMKELRLKTNGRIKLISEYSARDSAAEYKCLDCKTTFESTPYRIMRTTGKGCSKCSRQELQDSRSAKCRMLYKERLKNLGCSMLPVETYITATTKIKHECTFCGYGVLTTPDFMLKLAKCKSCSPKNKAKTLIVSGKTFSLFGYEDQALKILVAKNNVADISSYADGLVPLIYYKFKKVSRRYMPDFFLTKRNTLIEVKGLATFGMLPFPKSSVSDKDRYYETAMKAKACIASGYKYRLMLIVKGKVVKLPKEWFDKSFTWMRSFLCS